MSGVRHYWNEIDPYAAQWIRNLVDAGELPPGDVDERSIKDVTAGDLRGYTQCHFFAGGAGWSFALQYAGWPHDRECWTGSCPCQPFSAAGKRQGQADERHLWPIWFNLIKACRPKIVWGEQVASSEIVGSQLEASFVVAVQRGEIARANAIAKKLVRSAGFHYWERWLTGLRRDLDSADYTLRSEVLGAHSIGSPTIRQRVFWGASRVSNGNSQRRHWEPVCLLAGQPREADTEVARRGGNGRLSRTGCVVGKRWPCEQLPGEASTEKRNEEGFNRERSGSDGNPVRMDESIRTGLEGHSGDERNGNQPGRYGTKQNGPVAPPSRFSADACDWLDFRDGKTRPIEPGLECLVDEFPFKLADGRTGVAGQSRAQILKVIGNAIVPEVGATFIQAYLETTGANQ